MTTQAPNCTNKNSHKTGFSCVLIAITAKALEKTDDR